MTNETNHLYCALHLNDIVQNNIQIPERDFPKKVFIDTDEYFCGGYFAGYEYNYSENEIISLCQKKNFSELANTSADYVILFIEKLAGTVYVLTGQSGRFPMYFAIENKVLHLSTDFGYMSRKIKLKSINVNYLLNDIFNKNVTFLTDMTPFKQVMQVPPATLLTVTNDTNFVLTPLVIMDDFLPTEKKYSPAEFADRFVTLLDILVEERLKAIGNLPLIADLSSGYDSSVVAAALAKRIKLQALSILTSLAPDTNNQIVTEKFAKKHNIEVEFVDKSNTFLLSTDAGEKFLKRYYYPLDHGTDLNLQLYSEIYKKGYRIKFEGFGGDELYKSGFSRTMFSYPLQMEYFMFVHGLKTGIDTILSQNGVQHLLNKDRFINRNLFASGIATSATNIGLHYFPLYWQTGIWGISPLADPRMYKLAASCPVNGDKKSIWKHREDIFLKEQHMIPKGEASEHVHQFLSNPITRQKVISILQNSILTEMDIIKGDEIAYDLQHGNEKKYMQESSRYLMNSVMAELFLQDVLKGENY